MIYSLKNTLHAGKPAQAYLNGEAIKGAYMSKTGLNGKILRYKQPLRVDRNNPTRAERELLRGHVTVEFINGME